MKDTEEKGREGETVKDNWKPLCREGRAVRSEFLSLERPRKGVYNFDKKRNNYNNNNIINNNNYNSCILIGFANSIFKPIRHTKNKRKKGRITVPPFASCLRNKILRVLKVNKVLAFMWWVATGETWHPANTNPTKIRIWIFFKVKFFLSRIAHWIIINRHLPWCLV